MAPHPLMKPLIFFLLILFVLLQIKLWSVDGGLKESWYLSEELEKQRAENQQRHERNDVLEAEVRDLKGGMAAIEERARNELGMIRKGETFFQLVEPQADKDHNE